MLSILHISDLHFSAKNDEQTNFIRRAFFKDLSTTLTTYGRPGALVFSGDIAHDPDEADVYVKLIDHFIYPLERATGVPASRMVFCPGNHDVSLSKLRDLSLLREGLFKVAHDPNAVSSLYSQSKIDDYAHSVSRGFFEFCEYLGNPWDNPFYKVYEVADQNIIALNGAFSGSTEGSKADRGKRIFPLAAWDAAHAKVGSANVLGVTTHFPLSELNEAHSELAQRIHGAAELLFYGHLHDPAPSVNKSPAGTVFRLQSGALYSRENRFKGYSVIQAEAGNSQGIYRSYYDKRGEFDEALNVAARGRFYSSDKAEAYWKGQKPGFTREQLEEHLRSVIAPELDKMQETTLSGDKLSDVYVVPNFGEAEPGKVEENGDVIEKMRRVDDLQRSDDHVCFLFPDETGATSFVAHLAKLHVTEPGSFVAPRIPITVDLRADRGAEKGAYEPVIERLIKAGYPAIENLQFGWKARREDQPFAILVDNYDSRNESHVEWITGAKQLFPLARFLICAKSPFAGMHTARASSALRLPFGHKVWSLYPLDRKQVRSMVAKFALPTNMKPNIIVEEIFSKFRAVGIPLSGPVVAMYLTVLKENKKYSPVNTSSVMENFLEISLDKRKSLVVFQDDFDYREQINLLSVVAKEFVTRNTDCVTADECYEIVKSHYDRIGVRRDFGKIIRYFCDKGIMEDVSNSIYFKYSVIYSYLIAYRMTVDADFRARVLSGHNIHRFISEIDMYFGINRSDVDGLEKISARYNELLNKLKSEFGPLFDEELAAQLELPRGDDLEQFVETVATRINEQVEQQKDEERDRSVEPKAENSSQFIQKFRRPDSQDSLVEWVKVLCCYSAVLKNADDLPKELKAEHLAVIFQGWAKLSGFALQVVALLMSEGVAEIGNRRFEFRAKSITDPKIVRAIVASVPRYVSYYCGIYLSSGKLENILRPMKLLGLSDFLRTGILVDLRVDAFLHEIAGFRRRNDKAPTLMEAMLWKLRDSFLRFGLDKGYIDGFQSAIVELQADVLGWKDALRDLRVAAMLKKLNEARLLKRMRGE